ncbi:hypothetical protein SAMN06295879_1502 [Agreia bicolorata]|uniref:Uncharacterized protein n=1 Tax=Agreia bicolorata TaxID=110935 RepID=A0A1T4XR09_9MICO|nr:hypothetical protein [Agreia bicolorata]SKA91541.1 hypothetical protein SAMN06295879_1502 [Agreia bicolorata]
MSESLGADPAEQPMAQLSRWHRIRHALVTPELIYGTIMSSAVIAVAESDDDDFDVFVVTIVTMLVFWAAHVFATAVANHGVRGGRIIGIGQAFRDGVHHSKGLLYASVVPLVFLILGATGVLDETVGYFVALLVGMVVLGILGWMAFADRGSPWPVRLLGSIGTALFGLVIVVLKAVLH